MIRVGLVLVKANVRSTTKKLLLEHKMRTGKSMSELTEFAIINMPFIPSKRVQKE